MRGRKGGAIIGTYDPKTEEPVDKPLKLVNLEYYIDHASLLTHFVDAVERAGWCSREEIIESMMAADILIPDNERLIA